MKHKYSMPVIGLALACSSLLGKKNILDVFHNIPTASHATNTHSAPTIANPVLAPVVNTPSNIVPTVPVVDEIVPAVDALSTATDLVETVTNSALPTAPVVDEIVSAVDALSTATDLVETVTNSALPTAPVVDEIVSAVDPLSTATALISDLVNTNSPITVPDITAIPNVVDSSPVLVITDATPAQITTIEDTISQELTAKNKGHLITYYKKTIGKKTYFVFVPLQKKTAQKNYLSDAYQAVADFVTSLGSKIADYFSQNNTNNAIVYETTPSNLVHI